MGTIFRYSAIDTADRCLHKYKRVYIEGYEDQDSGDKLFGTALHAGIEALFTGGNGQEVFSLFWDSVKGSKAPFGRYDWSTLRDTGIKFIARFERLHLKRFEPFMLEYEMFGKVGRHNVKGTADYIGLYRGVPSIVDWKTSAREYVPEKILVAEQMPLYAELVKQCLQYEVKQIVYYVFCKSEVRIQTLVLPITQEWLQQKIKNIELKCDDLAERKVFPKNPNSCMMGTFKCPLFAECHGEDVENEQLGETKTDSATSDSVGINLEELSR